MCTSRSLISLFVIQLHSTYQLLQSASIFFDFSSCPMFYFFLLEFCCLSFKRQLQAIRQQTRGRKVYVLSSAHRTFCMSMAWKYCLSFHSLTLCVLGDWLFLCSHTQKAHISKGVNRISLLRNVGTRTGREWSENVIHCSLIWEDVHVLF